MRRLLAIYLAILSCGVVGAGGNRESSKDNIAEPAETGSRVISFQEEPETIKERRKMVSLQIESRGIGDQQVIDAIKSVPRHLFMPKSVRNQAYEDHPVPIGEGQTISQPYIVALMTESLRLEKSFSVLEIGTGSGYQAAVLSCIVDGVYSIEIREGLHASASHTLEELGYSNVRTMHADGYYGWEQYAPFDAIMITAAVDHIPQPLLKQLKDGGRLIMPLGDPYGFQDLVLLEKQGENIGVDFVTGVLFVPMTGKALQ